MQTTYRKEYQKAFTLAEVLITLGIIGIVAAMTLPTLIQKNEERVTVTKVKKFYSVMNQALLMAIKDNGYVDEWNFIETDKDNNRLGDKLAQKIKPYLKIAKDCGTNSNCITNDTYKLLNGSNWQPYTGVGYYKMILADGTYMWLRTNASGSECTDIDGGVQNTCGVIWIDINGKLPPNTIGKDTFNFVITKNRIIPSNLDDCNVNNAGWSCSAYILSNSNMKYLHK